MYEEDDDTCCLLCGDDSLDVISGWYGAKVSLCRSCRQQVVIRFTKKYPKIDLYPKRLYAHINTHDRANRSQLPWPYHGHDSTPDEETYSYIDRIRDFILMEVASPYDYREPYRTASLAMRQQRNRKTGFGVTPKKKVSAQKAAEAAQHEYRQAMLNFDFPPQN